MLKFIIIVIASCELRVLLNFRAEYEDQSSKHFAVEFFICNNTFFISFDLTPGWCITLRCSFHVVSCPFFFDVLIFIRFWIISRLFVEIRFFCFSFSVSLSFFDIMRLFGSKIRCWGRECSFYCLFFFNMPYIRIRDIESEFSDGSHCSFVCLLLPSSERRRRWIWQYFTNLNFNAKHEIELSYIGLS